VTEGEGLDCWGCAAAEGGEGGGEKETCNGAAVESEEDVAEEIDEDGEASEEEVEVCIEMRRSSVSAGGGKRGEKNERASWTVRSHLAFFSHSFCSSVVVGSPAVSGFSGRGVEGRGAFLWKSLMRRGRMTMRTATRQVLM
jgi:hypothetical protein